MGYGGEKKGRRGKGKRRVRGEAEREKGGIWGKKERRERERGSSSHCFRREIKRVREHRLEEAVFPHLLAERRSGCDLSPKGTGYSGNKSADYSKSSIASPQ